MACVGAWVDASACMCMYESVCGRMRVRCFFLCEVFVCLYVCECLYMCGHVWAWEGACVLVGVCACVVCVSVFVCVCVCACVCGVCMLGDTLESVPLCACHWVWET